MTNADRGGVTSADVGVSAKSVTGPMPDGGNMSYIVTVTNHSATVTATGVALTVEPSAGVGLVGYWTFDEGSGTSR